MVSDNANILEKFSPLAKEAYDFVVRSKEIFEIARRKNNRDRYERHRNLAYYYNRQNVQWLPGQSMPTERDTGQSNRLIVDNVIRQLTEAWVAALIDQPPKYEVIASSPSQFGMELAKNDTRLCEMLWHHLQLRNVYRKALLMARIFKCAYIHTYWDATAGRIIDGLAEGDVACEVVNPMQIDVDPSAEDVRPEIKEPTDAKWISRTQVIPIEKILAVQQWQGEMRVMQTTAGNQVYYGGLPSDLREIASHDSSVPTREENALLAEIDRTAREEADGMSPENRDNGGGRVALVRTYWEHPSEVHPHGRYCVTLPGNSDKIIEYRNELPFATKEHPQGLFGWVLLKDRDIPGKLSGQSVISEVIPFQDRINELTTQVHAMIRKYVPVMLWDKFCGISPKSYVQATISGVLEFDSRGGPGREPHILWPAEIQSFISAAAAEIQRCKQICQDKMSVHQISDYPRSNPTAFEVSQFLQQDATKWADDAKRYEPKIAEQMKIALRLVQRGYTTERVMKYLNRSSVQAIRVKASDVHIDDVKIVPGSMLPENRAQQVQHGLFLIQQGFFKGATPDEDKKLRNDALRILQLNLPDEETHDQLNAARSAEENMAVFDGMPLYVPRPWENHVIHMTEHYRLLLSGDFSRIDREKQNKIAEKMLQHIAQHNLMRMKQQMSEGNTGDAPMLGAATQEGASFGAASQIPAMAAAQNEQQAQGQAPVEAQAAMNPQINQGEINA
jgi:hypothetical protein